MSTRATDSTPLAKKSEVAVRLGIGREGGRSGRTRDTQSNSVLFFPPEIGLFVNQLSSKIINKPLL